MSDSIGTQLRDARLSRGEDVGDVADALKIRRSHVVAMESENYSALGAAPYVRGHLRNYARHVGLDAERLVGMWDEQHGGLVVGAHSIATSSSLASGPPREPVPRWIVVAGLVVVVLAALALIGQLGDRSPASFEPIAVPPTAAPSATETPTSEPTPTRTRRPRRTRQPAPDPEPTPTPTPTPDGVNLLLAFQQDVWVAITVDGAAHPRSQTIFAAGEVLRIEADNAVQIRYGNAGGVNVELNGERLGQPGDNGQIADVVYRPNGARSA